MTSLLPLHFWGSNFSGMMFTSTIIIVNFLVYPSNTLIEVARDIYDMGLFHGFSDIKLINKGKSCPEGFYPINLGSFPTVMKGYSCSSSTNNQTFHLAKPKDRDCVEISLPSKSSFISWKDLSFCVTNKTITSIVDMYSTSPPITHVYYENNTVTTQKSVYSHTYINKIFVSFGKKCIDLVQKDVNFSGFNLLEDYSYYNGCNSIFNGVTTDSNSFVLDAQDSVDFLENNFGKDKYSYNIFNGTKVYLYSSLVPFNCTRILSDNNTNFDDSFYILLSLKTVLICFTGALLITCFGLYAKFWICYDVSNVEEPRGKHLLPYMTISFFSCMISLAYYSSLVNLFPTFEDRVSRDSNFNCYSESMKESLKFLDKEIDPLLYVGKLNFILLTINFISSFTGYFIIKKGTSRLNNWVLCI